MTGPQTPSRRPANRLVVFVAGSGRSGSTLVDGLLGAHDGWFSAGEVGGIWGRGLIGEHLCACGAPVGRCEMWREILERAGIDLGPHEIVQLQASVMRHRHIGSFLLPPAVRGDAQRYAAVMDDLYHAIFEVTGARVVVDSSKRPGAAAVLAHTSLDGFLLHIVRDSRAVVRSWQKAKPIPGPPGAKLAVRSAPSATASWWSANTLVELVGSRLFAGSRLRLRYEDMVVSPRLTLDLVETAVGTPLAPRQLVAGDSVDLPPSHMVSGNPSRFHHGPTRLRLDDEWRTGLSPAVRRAVTVATAPMLWRYGYSLRS